MVTIRDRICQTDTHKELSNRPNKKKLFLCVWKKMHFTKFQHGAVCWFGIFKACGSFYGGLDVTDAFPELLLSALPKTSGHLKKDADALVFISWLLQLLPWNNLIACGSDSHGASINSLIKLCIIFILCVFSLMTWLPINQNQGTNCDSILFGTLTALGINLIFRIN